MKQIQLNNETITKIHNRTIVGFVAGFLVPFSFWIYFFSTGNYPVAFRGVILVNNDHPVLYLLLLVPFAIAAAVYFISFRIENRIKSLEEEILKKEESINKNAAFAKKIGEGDYTADFEEVSRDDMLGQSLLLMRRNLVANRKKEEEQNWIAEGKEIVANILRLNNNLDELTYEVLVLLIKYIRAIQGAVYIYNEESSKLVNFATYAFNRKKYVNQEFKIGQGLIGQCAFERDIIYRTEIPDDYMTITSGIMGDKKPKSLLLVPLITDEKLQGVLEFASLENEISELTIVYLRELGEIIARTIFNLNINQKTEKLLLEAQQMTMELRENEEQLRQNAEEMRATHEELEKSNTQLESKVKEVEIAQKRLHSLLENASEIISIYDRDLKPKYQSPSTTRILGYTPEEMMEGKDFDRLTPKGDQELREMFSNLLKNPVEPVTIQYTYIKKDGKKIFIETTGRNMLHDPAIDGIIMNSQDITERVRAEKEERMRSKMQALSENSLDVIVRIGITGKFFYANPMFENFTGLKVSGISNKTISEVELNEILFEFFKEAIKKIKLDPDKLNAELTIPLDEEERIMSFNAIPEFNENELESILFVGHDITEAKRIEREIQDKNRKITESINYAERIQSSILPNSRFIREFLPKSFIFYVPRDVVSGDFPWFFHKGDNIFLAAVDCTGHGVPGALLSFIGYFILNNVVDHDRELTAGDVLDQLHYGVRRTLKQDMADANARDGMDIALCKINLKEQKVEYAGAHRPLYLLRQGELQEFKGDRKAIGGIPHRNKPETNFTNYTLDIKKGDKIFFFSDGLPDQIGGEEGKKYGPPRIREIISANPDFKMEDYHKYFAGDYEKWKGNFKQIDDILLIGIEF
jgi:PAS domain S-box-containing protein